MFSSNVWTVDRGSSKKFVVQHQHFILFLAESLLVRNLFGFQSTWHQTVWNIWNWLAKGIPHTQQGPKRSSQQALVVERLGGNYRDTRWTFPKCCPEFRSFTNIQQWKVGAFGVLERWFLCWASEVSFQSLFFSRPLRDWGLDRTNSHGNLKVSLYQASRAAGPGN